MKKSKICFLLFCLCFTAFLISCHDSDDDIMDECSTEIEKSLSDGSAINDLSYLTSEIPVEYVEGIKKRFTKTATDIDDKVKVLFVTSSNINQYTDAIQNIIDRNGVIIIVEPKYSILKKWADDNFTSLAVDENIDKDLFFAFSNQGTYSINIPTDFNDIEEYLNTLTNWVNENLNPLILGDGEFDTQDVTKLFGSQTITKSYTFNLNERITPKYENVSLSGKGEVVMKLNVYPLYVFENQAEQGGDYYIVNLYVKINSDGLYVGNGKKNSHGVITRYCGFYLKQAKIYASLCDANDAVFEFGCSPTPQSSVSSTSYTSGVEWGIGASLSGSFESSEKGKKKGVSATITGGVKYSDTKTRELKDVEIGNNSGINSAAFLYKINNLPSYSKLKISDPPMIARSGAEFYHSWIWHVPSTKNYSENKFKVKFGFSELIYGASRFFSTKADYVDLDYDIISKSGNPDLLSCTNELKAPSRIPSGSVEIVNSFTDKSISGIKITGTANGEPITIDDKNVTYAPTEVISYILPVGHYSITFKAGKNQSEAKEYKLVNDMRNLKLGEKIRLQSEYDFTAE